MLNVSRPLASVVVGNPNYSVITARASSFDGLMDPLLGFELFRMRTQMFRPRPFAGVSVLTYLFAESAPCRLLDTTGTDRLLQPGGTAWAEAGKGMVRALFPESAGSASQGIQLLLNVPAKHKHSNPRVAIYEAPPLVPNGHRAHIRMVMDSAELNFLHISAVGGERIAYDLPVGWNATIHFLDGAVQMQTSGGLTELGAGTTMALGQSSMVERISFVGRERYEFLLVRGIPIREQVFGSETMSMSSTGELGKALADYEEGKMGFITLTAGKWQIIPPTIGNR